MTADVPPPSPLAEEAQDLLRTCEQELALNPDPLRAARLHYEMAMNWEEVLADPARATQHYREALARAPEHLPSVRGARRVLRARGKHREALPLFDAEIRLASDPRRKALLLYEKGCVLENDLQELGGAREAYLAGLDLDKNNASLLKAVERHYAHSDDRNALARTFERTANAIADDPRHRAALMIGHARLLPDERPVDKIELYEAALKLDHEAPGALESLKRLYHQTGRWQKLIDALEREAEQTEDESLRSLALYRIGTIFADRLASRAEAIAALEAAAAVTPGDQLVLEDLARLYEADENHEALARVLEAFVETATEPAEKLALFHRLGQLSETYLAREDAAIRCYRSALEIDPAYVPALQALGAIYRQREDWTALMQMHLAEAKASDDSHRRADAHARVAEIYEVNLDHPVDAAEHHARALALEPGYPTSFKALARLYSQAGRFRELVELYERTVDEGPAAAHKIAYLFKIGAVWEDSLDDPVQAAHAYRRVLELDSNSLLAIHALQRVNERAGRYQELVEALELEVARADDAELKMSLVHRAGTILDEQLDDRDAAIVRFRKVLEMNPTFVPALASLGRIYYREGRWADLLEMYKRELEVKSEGPGAVALLYRMGEVCEKRLGNQSEAIEYYRRAAELDPTHRPALRALIRILEGAELWPRLAEVLELEASGTEDALARAVVFFRLGRVYETRLDEPFKAAAAYEKALIEVPNYRPAIDAISRVRAERRAWQQLVGDLSRDEQNTDDTARSAAALMRQGEIWRDKLGEPVRAIACFEELLAIDASYLPAWLALEPLHAKTENWKALAATYRKQASLFSAPGARVAALRELARILETRGVGTPEDLVATYDKILKNAPDDHAALLALERVGRASGNRVLLTRVEARLGASSEDAAVAGYHFTCLGRTLEGVSDDIAIDSYRGALAKDPENLSAVQGLARVAERNGDLEALAEALGRQAAITQRGEAAARLLVRSARIRLEHKGDAKGALADLERALEASPDDTEAAELVTNILLSAGKVERLVDLLSRAAGSAAAPSRVAALWIDVAQLYARELDNIGAAIATLNRALRSLPDHLPTLRLLAELHVAERKWSDARNLYERVLASSSDPGVLHETHLALAAIYDEHLGDAEKARASVDEILKVDGTNLEALARLVEIQLRTGDLVPARTTARQVVELSTGTAEHSPALLRLARLERKLGDIEGALSALLDAVLLEGPSGDAGRSLEQMIASGQGTWNVYADAISGYLSEERRLDDDLAGAYLKLATVQAEMLEDSRAAVKTLERGVEATGADSRLVEELAKWLGQSGQPGDAVSQLRTLLDADVSRAGTWRVLHGMLAESGRSHEAALTLGVLAVLGVATDDELSELRTRTRKRGRARAGSFDQAALRTIAAEDSLSTAAAELLSTLCVVMPKIHPANLDGLGLSKKDRISSRTAHAMRTVTDELASIFDVGEYDLYEHMLPDPLVSVEATDPPAVAVSERLSTLPESEQIFLLAYAMASISARFYPAVKLSARELELMLTAAGRSVVPGFGNDVARPGELDDLSQQIRKAVPRKWRRPVEEVARRYVSDPCADFGSWSAALEYTAVRAACLLSGDLPNSVGLLRHYDADIARYDGKELARESDLVADLLKFWASEEAMAFRRRAGLLPVGVER